MSTLDASHMTKRRRSSELAGIREAVSGGEKAAAVQLEDELDKEGRKKLMTDSEFRKKVTTKDALAMKATLALPWNKLRIMRRYNYRNYTCTHTHPTTFTTYSTNTAHTHAPIQMVQSA